MKTVRLIFATLLFAVAVILPVAAQTPAAQPSGIKAAVIDTTAFSDEKQGITRYVTALKQVNTEFQPRFTELQTLGQKIQTLQDDYKKQAESAVADPKALEAKRDEGERLAVDYKRREEDLQAAYNKRRGEVLGPLSQEIFSTLNEYAKQRGIDLVFDVSRDEKQLVLLATEKADITLDFIKVFNARPANTATATPKPAATPAKPATAKP